MGVIRQIIQGHINEFSNNEEELRDYRMSICDQCPLEADAYYGKICSNKRYLNIRTGKARTFPCDECVQGCGCRLEAKTRVKDAHCPANKW